MQLVAPYLCADWAATAVTERRPVLGILEGPYLAGMSESGMIHFRQMCRTLLEAGFDIKPVAALPEFKAIVARHNLIVAAEAARFHRLWYDEHKALYHPKTVELIERGLTVSDEALAEAVNGRVQLRSELTSLMFEHDLDLWLSPPATGTAPYGLKSTGDPIMNLPWTHSGLPTITLPAGKNEEGLPLGLQCTGHWYADEELLGFARQIEDALSQAGVQ